MRDSNAHAEAYAEAMTDAIVTGGWGMSSYDDYEPLCAACGQVEGLIRTAAYGEIPFCEECLERSFERTLWDDLGEVD